MLLPFDSNGLVDMLPGDYARHCSMAALSLIIRTSSGCRTGKYLAGINSDVGWPYLGSFPCHCGNGFRHSLECLWDYMGVSVSSSSFDPLIELYRPVLPLAWLPYPDHFWDWDDGKNFLLFMVAFAIMVIPPAQGHLAPNSLRSISHSLGATDRQILRHVILPNAMPEIQVSIAIGVCWGTLVAAEMLAGTTGVGFIENVARTVSDWVDLGDHSDYGCIRLIFDLIMRWVISKTIPWRGKG